MDVLHRVTIRLPQDPDDFGRRLLELLTAFGERDDDALVLRGSEPGYLPVIALELAPVPRPAARFEIGRRTLSVEIVNSTGRQRASRHAYEHIDIDDFVRRLGPYPPVRLDHVGMNLPWFGGLHPQVTWLRAALSRGCAYYSFPSGEPWDFILPATEDEIGGTELDLERDRHPKFEIVSFVESSTPLIQFDLAIDAPFEDIRARFPESIVDERHGNVWVYLRNPYGVDICPVVGPARPGDWSATFAGYRLQQA